jgi:hypothetical protein
MEPSQYQFVTEATASTTPTPAVGFDIFSTIYYILAGNDTTAALLNPGSIISFLNIIWSIFVVLSFAASIFMLVLYAHASTRRWQYYAQGDRELRDAEVLYDEMYRGVRKSSRLNDVFTHIESANPNDWKLAIIEADIMLDDVLKQRGYVGNSLGERLKGISPGQLNSLDDAWEAHKIRNRVAHDGADFVLTKREAEETINRYRRVFSEFGMN